VPDIVDVEAIGERVVAAASVCRECTPLMLVADVEPGSDPGRPVSWAFAYGAPVAGRLLDLAASDDHFWSLMADPGGSSLTLWWSSDGSRWEPFEPALDLPEAMAFDERGGVELLAMADKLVVVGSGATVKDELQRSFAIVVPAVDPAD
jgi:hypothetical protein